MSACADDGFDGGALLVEVGRKVKCDCRTWGARARASRLAHERVGWRFVEPVAATGVMTDQPKERSRHPVKDASVAAVRRVRVTSPR
jgi:hypothetical protein